MTRIHWGTLVRAALAASNLLVIAWHLVGILMLPEAMAEDGNWPFGANLFDRSWASREAYLTFTLLSIPVVLGSLAAMIVVYRRRRNLLLTLAIVAVVLLSWSSYGWDWPITTS